MEEALPAPRTRQTRPFGGVRYATAIVEGRVSAVTARSIQTSACTRR